MGMINRREMLKLGSAGSLAASILPGSQAIAEIDSGIQHAPVPQWEVFEIALSAAVERNPFTAVQLSAIFTLGHRTITTNGFYDGEGRFKVRFMPDAQGEWSYITESSVSELSGKTGKFSCVAPLAGSHGPVGVCNGQHFAYADGTPYFPFGTTCYAWVHQSESLQLQTLETLRSAPFRMAM